MRSPDFIPKIITTFREGYTATDLRRDAIAGLTVAIIALPLAMALAIASGAPPDRGLITAIIAGFLISLLGGSRVQIGGPTGAFVVVVFAVIAEHGYDGLLLATFMAGGILLLAGFFKLGGMIKYIPHTVITGFTAGIAVIIATSQIKDFTGISLADVPADFIPKWIAYISAFPTLQPLTCLIGGVTLLGLIMLAHIAPKIPAFLIAVIAASIIVYALDLPVATIGSYFPDIPRGLPLPQLPDWRWEKMNDVFPAALTIAFLAGIEALLSAMVADGMAGFRHRSNQELIAQGVANIATPLFGGLPATGAIARTAANIKAGGRTPMAGIFHAGFLLLFMIFAVDWIKFIPMPALAAILFMVAWGMSERKKFLNILKTRSADRFVLILTFLLTILADLSIAISVGVILALLLQRRAQKS